MIKNISVIGTGYLGATHAACMAELGFDVVGVDVDPEKIEHLSRGDLPFHEPGLPELIRRHVDSGRLRFTTDLEAVGGWADVHFIAVGTPQQAGGTGADLTYVDTAAVSLAQAITKDSLIVGKSTVPVGTARRLSSLIAEESRDDVSVSLAWNPEFLREGFAVEDTLRPDRLVVGVGSEADEAVLREVYAEALGRETPWVSTDFETAELVKVAANAFLATKISFINAFSEVTETVGGDIRTLADAIGHDTRIGRKFLNAGVGFGGGCLPKDIRALQTRVSELGLDHTMTFLNEMDQINLRRRERVVTLSEQILGDLAGRRIAVLGVTFKPLSDDVRDSPGLDVANRLFNAGADVFVYDPEGNANAAKRFPRLGYVDSLAEAARDADLVVLTTEWNEFKALTPADLEDVVAARNFLDARHVLDAGQWESAGWTFAQLGRMFPQD
ncbi:MULTISPECIES: UDP-glucose dehydrogenase family protein [unclassified Nesterenkonia]|uniref:UDP-glucose dehydrogenase family protein n=1 Tax=unclassified Nesterenkonia TaxID=2629769 RepID=UPI0009F40326|nr:MULTISPECIES: UDP-glucose/GDP-mannose dehydrogenase family protein [unclassified Nesterenkonia]MDS2171553.1 UDP-glucose/GDP-mannose dehydrogenase family protein [Nesterenkonia sp. CL21]OSM43723.1 UDP-glucose 6-dehydrogenase [Nesterenkonia sp. PF2B19]